MNLKTLLEPIETISVEGPLNPEVTGIQYDSRRVEAGNVFVALRGERTDGHRFIDHAISQGAVAVVSEQGGPAQARSAFVRVADTVDALARLSAAFHGHPSRAMKMVGVTGTNGKTTFTFLLKSILEQHGMKAGLIGTIRYEVGERQIPADRTTPQSSDLQQLLAQMKKGACKAVVLEVSSHSLVQRRVEEVEFDVAVFTNLTQDHLDYHKTMEEYFQAKSLLFSGLGKGAKKLTAAVINLDDPRGAGLKKLLGKGVRCLTYGVSKDADLRPAGIELSLNGSRFVAETPRGKAEISLHLCGRYNVQNALAALGAALALDVPMETAVRGLGDLASVPGRLEAVRLGQPFHLFVDYAHTDDALENVLSMLKELVSARLIVVFGCGGNRDTGKRPRMGRVAAQHADHAVITSDNPRKEDPALIARQVEAGFDNASTPSGTGGCTHEIILDREKAIRRAIELAQPGDIVLIAGKGHETYQEFADTMTPFDDRAVAANLLKQRTWKN